MKDFNIAKYLRENHLGSHAILGAYVDLHNLKEEEETKLDTEIPYEGPEHKLDGFGDEFEQDSPVEEAEDGSFNVSLMYADYPSITDAEQRLATIHLKKLVKSLGGIATITNDNFDTVDFNVKGISSFEELQNAYNDVVENEDDDYIMLPSWDLEPKEDSPVQELEKPEKIYSNDWMNNSIDDKRVGSWTCYYEDQMGTIYWVHDNIPGEHIMVYATPNWDGAKGIAIEVQVDYGEHTLDQEVVGDPSYPDFESYAQDMIPILNKVESKYKSGKYHDYIDYGDSMDTDDSVNPFPSIMKEKEDDSFKMSGGAFDYEEDDRFASLGGDEIKSAIKSLMDDGFDSREIAQFVVDTIRGFKSFKEEVTVSSSGVQMEGEEFKWTARDQQGKLHGILYVKPMGDTLMVTADDGMPGTKYTKADIADAMGRGEFIRFRGKDLALDTRMKAWANS